MILYVTFSSLYVYSVKYVESNKNTGDVKKMQTNMMDSILKVFIRKNKDTIVPKRHRTLAKEPRSDTQRAPGGLTAAHSNK